MNPSSYMIAFVAVALYFSALTSAPWNASAKSEAPYCRACQTAPARFAHPQQPTTCADTSLFAALVRYATRVGLKHEVRPQQRMNVHVDPRVLDSTFHWQQGLDREHLQGSSRNTSSAQIQARAAVLERLNVPRANVLDDNHCTPTAPLPNTEGGWPAERTRSYCQERGQFVSVIFSRPHATSDTSCASSTGKTGDSLKGPRRQEQGGRCLAVRAAELTHYSIFTYALYVRQGEGGAWTVAGKKSLGGVFQ